MIPENISIVQNELEESAEPSFDYIIDFENGCLKPPIEGIEVVKQAVALRLLTEADTYKIYSESYGLPIYKISAMSAPFCYVDIKNRIKSVLCADDRINDVYNFSFSLDNDGVYVNFTVDTKEGIFTEGVNI